MAIIDGSRCMIATCAALRRHDHYRVMAVAGLSGWLIGTAALLVPVMDARMVEALTVVWVSAAGITTVVARAQSGPGLGLINAIAVAAGCLGFCATLWTVAPSDTVVAVRWLGCFALALGCMRLWVAARVRAKCCAIEWRVLE